MKSPLYLKQYAFIPETLFSICVHGNVLFITLKEGVKNILLPEAHVIGLNNNNRDVSVAHQLA